MPRKYDRTQIFEEKIQPLLTELEKTCYRYHIPLFVSAAVQETGKDTVYKHVYISPAIVKRELSEDKLSHFIRVIHGYKTISPTDDVDFDF